MLAELSAKLCAQIQGAATILRTAQRVCILTGAGVSAESGIPTFRDKQTGLWAHYNAEDLASIDGFAREPELVWAWYQWRRELVHDKTPNPAHYALARWQEHITLSHSAQQLTLITQNVDDLHEQAGSTVTHLHGHLNRNRCSQCDTPYNAPIVSTAHQVDFGVALLNCDHCGSYIRPDIVWFGEALPVDAWQTAEDAAANCDVFISIGTSSMVYPAAGLAHLAQQNGATLIEINPNPTSNTVVDITLAAAAGVVMPALLQGIITSSPPSKD
ncbi:NAD-dependent deacylase [Psychrobacter sp. 16-MNA-CIBAN-0192]|uniref:NAD-dependent deacylase n=1 Tax=Psychrobacter sp. 16-MNA-CIBAN-0192 TaxID=3140448 RepID=UPI0033249F6D